MLGQVRCRRHGGALKRSRAAAQRRLAEAKATKAIAREKLTPVDDPIGALRELAAEAIALKRYFGERVAALQSVRYEGHGGAGEQVRAEMTLFGQMFDRSAKLCESLARLGLDDRVARIEEAKVVLLVAVLEKVLASPELALDPGRQARGRELLADALEGGQ
ncbi:MAG: hypothetical protein WA695_01255 [Candidatus Dormiibacterota bacterium]